MLALVVALAAMGGVGGGAAAAPVEPAPQASTAVQRMLEEAGQAARGKQPAAALLAAERALVAAREARDGVGEAWAHEARAQALADLGRVAEAVAAWRLAAEVWERAGDGPGRVRALAAAGMALWAENPGEAGALVAQAAAIGRAEGKRPLAAAGVLHEAGVGAFERQRLKAAREFYGAALFLRQEHAPGTLEEAKSRANLGNVEADEGHLAAATELHRGALALFEKLAPESLEVATCLSNLGTLAYRQGDLKSAEKHFRRALAIAEKEAPGSPDVAWYGSSLGSVALEQGQLAVAEEQFRRALAIQERLVPGSPELAQTLASLGRVAGQRGNSNGARDYFRRALAIQVKRVPDSVEVATSLRNLGGVAQSLGDLAAAREYYLRAMALQEKVTANSLQMAAVLRQLGSVASQQGDFEAAMAYYQRALEIAAKVAPDSLAVASSLNNLGTVALAQGDLAAAREYQRQALLLQEKRAPDSLAVAGTLHRLGDVANAERDWPAATTYYERALQLFERWAPESRSVVYVLRDLGIVAFQKGDPAAAKAYYQRALSLQKRLAPNPRSEASILHRLGMLAQVQGDLREAERCSRRAWELVCEEAATVAGDEARQAFGATIADFAAVLMRTQMLLGQSDKAWLTLEQSRAQALQQLLSERDLLVHGAPGRLQAAYREAVAARDRAEQEAGGISAAGTRAQRTLAAAEEAHAGAEVIRASRAAVASAAQQQAEAQSAYVAARLKTEELWRKIRQSAPRAFPERLTEMARHSLLAGSLFVAFAVDEEGAFLFLLRPLDGRKLVASFVPIGIPSKELRTRVEAFRSQLTDPEVAAGETAAAGRELFAKLFPPEARQEIQSARRLLISPDGPLWDLPFAALVTNAGGAPRYLGTSKPITYTQSLTLFAQSRRDAPHLASGARPRVVVVGNPRFQRAPMLLASGAAVRGEREYLLLDARPPAPLPATGREAAAIAQLYGTVPLTDAAATEAALRAGIGRADVIHLATHGYLHPVRPMSSGVLLAAPAAKPEIGETRNDGVLQAWEVYSQLQLKAELVVLSACETGRGKNVPGEGIVGLTRALQYAGARSIVASQWKVADTSTTTLMIRLHRRLREGVAKDEALRQAMAAVQGNPQTAHPYYWSAFFLTGDPDNPNLGAARTAGGISQRPSRRGSAPVRSRQGSGKAVR